MAKSREKAIKDVERAIVPVSEAAPYVKLLLYGRNGKGKTRVGASSKLKTLVVDINEEGTTSIRNYPNTFVFQVKRWEDLIYVFWFLKNGNHDFEVVMVDTLTQLQKLCMATVLKKAEDRDPNRPPKMPDRRVWGQVGEMMGEQILNFRNLPMHVVFTCQVRKDFNEDEEEATNWVPNLSPASRGPAMDNVGIIGYVYKGRVKVVNKKKKKTQDKWVTKVLVGDHDNYETKDRTGQLGMVLAAPTLDTFIEAWAAAPPEEEE